MAYIFVQETNEKTKKNKGEKAKIDSKLISNGIMPMAMVIKSCQYYIHNGILVELHDHWRSLVRVQMSHTRLCTTHTQKGKDPIWLAIKCA